MAKRTDNNHSEIVKGLRAIGARVQSIASVGRGVPDLLVAHNGKWYVAEIKDGDKFPSQRKLTIAEEAWHEEFSVQAPVHIWASLADALKAIGL